MLVVFDNINLVMNGCYHRSELEFIEVFNEILSLSEKDSKISIAVGVNRDLLDE